MTPLSLSPVLSPPLCEGGVSGAPGDPVFLLSKLLKKLARTPSLAAPALELSICNDSKKNVEILI